MNNNYTTPLFFLGINEIQLGAGRMHFLPARFGPELKRNNSDRVESVSATMYAILLAPLHA